MATNIQYIYNEQAQGTLDGVNKVFTVSKTIDSVESIRIGYVEYTNFAFVWNTITLADAPSPLYWWVYVDYFYWVDNLETFFTASLIYDEALSGEVNWVNKTFTTVYPIDKVDELRVSSIPYTNFTVNGRYVILNDAPIVSQWAPRIDYYREDSNVWTIDSWVTMEQLRSSIYTRLGQTITSLQYPKELVDEYIREWVGRVSKLKRDKRKRSVFTFHKAADWLIASVTWSNINIWTTSKFLPSQWNAVVDGWNYINYAYKTATDIQWISWLSVEDIEWKAIVFGYRLPHWVDKISEVFLDWFKLTPSDFAEYRAHVDSDKFCVHNGYLFIPKSFTDGRVVTVVYYALHVYDYDDNDIIDFDWDYIPVIKSYVLYNVYKDREDDRFINEYNAYKEILKEYKRELSRQYETTSAVFQTASILNKW